MRLNVSACEGESFRILVCIQSRVRFPLPPLPLYLSGFPVGETLKWMEIRTEIRTRPVVSVTVLCCPEGGKGGIHASWGEHFKRWSSSNHLRAMNRYTIAVFLAATTLHTLPSLAQDPPKADAPVSALDWKTANRASFSVEVKELMSGKVKVREGFKSDYGSYDRDEMRVRRIGVSLRNSGRVPGKITLEAIWFVTPERPPKGSVGQIPPAVGEVKVVAEPEIKAGQTLSFETEFSTTSNRTRYEALGESYASGTKFSGWVVVARAEGKILSYKASSPTLERMIADQSINAALADFQKSKSN